MRSISFACPAGYARSAPPASSATVDAARREGGAVGRAVDAVGGARDDGDAAAGEVGGQLERDVLAVAGRRAGTDEGDRRRSRRDERVDIAPHPEAERRVIDPDRSSGAGHCASSGVISRDPGAPRRPRARPGRHSASAVARHRSRPSCHSRGVIAGGIQHARIASALDDRSSAASGPSCAHDPPRDAVARLDEAAPDVHGVSRRARVVVQLAAARAERARLATSRGSEAESYARCPSS